MRSFFKKLDETKPVLICVHCIDQPDKLKYIYHSIAGNITCMCDADHDVKTDVDGFRWAHAQHMNDKFPPTVTLTQLPPNHVAMLYFDEGPKWVVESLIHGEE